LYGWRTIAVSHSTRDSSNRFCRRIPPLGDEFFATAKRAWPPVQIDWSQCPDVEQTPGKVSGAWCVKGRRIPVVAILGNAADCTAEQIADMFEVPVDVVRRILRHAGGYWKFTGRKHHDR
jgi:uncharacterized protein (DUF433 family)